MGLTLNGPFRLKDLKYRVMILYGRSFGIQNKAIDIGERSICRGGHQLESQRWKLTRQNLCSFHVSTRKLTIKSSHNRIDVHFTSQLES